MAGREEEGPFTVDSEFIEDSHLSYAVPFSSSPDLAELLKQNSSNGSSSSPFKSLEQRDFLFFDESVNVYLILRTPRRNEEYLRPLIARVSLSLEAHIVNSTTLGRDHSPPASETIFSDDAVERSHGPGKEDNAIEPCRGDNGPLILHQDGEEEEKERFSFAIWKVPVLIARPRIRLQNPVVVFSAAAYLRAPAESDESGTDLDDNNAAVARNGYLQSRAPVGLNLLEPFAKDPALHGFKPRLSAQRVSLVVPITQSKDFRRPIMGLQKLNFKVVAAVHTRVKFARPNALPASSTVIGMLELDFTPYFDCETVLTNISLSLPSGVVTDLNSDAGLKLPLSCVAHDHVTFLYRLAPAEHEQLLEGAPMAVTVPGTPQLPNTPARDLDISIEVKALIRPGECTPRLAMAWSTPVDFTPPVNPGFGASSMSPSLQRSHRPSQLSIDGASSMVNPAVARPDSLPGLEAATQRNVETTIPDFGITITFTGPKKPARVGQEFCWSVFVANRSGTSVLPISNAPPVSRKLALRVIPKRRRTNDVRVVRPPTRRQQPAATAKGNRDQASREQELVADAVVDENIVHAMQRSSLVEGYDVLCLSADARVGPLAPGACHVVDLRFVALRAGTLTIEAVRVLDMVSQEHVDVRELPAIYVEPQ